MNTCPRCGAHNRPEARFCKQCALALPQCALALPQCALALPQCALALPPADALACPHCGEALRPGARFCKQCGKPVTGDLALHAHHTCPSCGAPVRESARFCPVCRAALTTTPAPAAGPRCPTCGAPTRSGARFCKQCSHPLAAAAPPLPPPPPPDRFGTGEMLPLTTLAGRYVILEKIAQGGMGAVYKVQDKRLQGKIVAVKEMSESAIAPRSRRRVLESFWREAELLARLAHPNLARVTDRFHEDDRHFMVMEFIEGQTLEKMLAGRSDPFSEEQVLIWADQLCDVFSYLHSQRPPIIYRDVKPANVMVMDGSDQVKLIDFGIARFFKASKRKDTIEFGTDGYAPPEQYGKTQTDERADIYALGVMLHQLLTLRDPTTRLFHFPPVRSLNPEVSHRVDAAIARAVENNKDKRHQSMQDMRTALLGSDAAQKPKSTHRGKKKPAQSVASIDFGEVLIGDDAPTHPLPVALPAGEQATLSTDVPWLRIHPQKISQGSAATVTLDTGRLRPGRLQLSGNVLKRTITWPARYLVPAEQEIRAPVEIELKSGKRQQVQVSVTVVPQAKQVRLGWMKTIVAVLLEAAVAVFALGALAMIVLGASF